MLNDDFPGAFQVKKMSATELFTYVLDVALTYSKDAFPSGDHMIRLPGNSSHASLRISVDLISSVEYQFAEAGERMDMRDFVDARMEAFMAGVNNGSRSTELTVEFPCVAPAGTKKAEGPSTSKGPR